MLKVWKFIAVNIKLKYIKNVTNFQEVFVVLCLMLAIVAAYPSEDVVKSVEPVAIESNESVSNEEQDLSGAESRYGFGGFGKGL